MDGLMSGLVPKLLPKRQGHARPCKAVPYSEVQMKGFAEVSDLPQL